MPPAGNQASGMDGVDRTVGTEVDPPVGASVPPGAPRDDEVREAQVREGMWIEIIRHMERIYADLARTQSEMEERTDELLEAKEFADDVIRSMVNALVVTDRWGSIELANHAALDLFGCGREQLIGKPLKMLFVEKTHRPSRPLPELWSRLMECGAVHNEETVARGDLGRRDDRAVADDDQDGERLIPVGFSGSVLHDSDGDVVGVVVVVRDLRETKRLLASAAEAATAERLRAQELAQANRELRHLQDQLIQAEKMSSLGRLSAGIAHELNNPLGGIVVYSHLLLEDTPPHDERRPNIEKIVHLCLRCREIVQDLLGFARPPTSGEERVDLNETLRRAADVFGGQALFHNVSIEWALSPESLVVMGDPGQLQQAFGNIILNAAQAMDGAGRILVRTERARPGRDADRRRRDAPPEDRARATVCDTGPGIPPENLAKLFEPFFTTKEAGQGTGLGLAITYGIVERHRGTIQAISRPGGGACFVVSLPAAAKRESDSDEPAHSGC